MLKGLSIVDQLYKLMGLTYTEYTRGKLLIATSIDANGHISRLAFAILEEESQDCWSWCLIALRHHCTQREGICLISDRHVGINAAVRNPTVG